MTAVLTWISKPLHPITWGTFPLFLIHTIIGPQGAALSLSDRSCGTTSCRDVLGHGRISVSHLSGPRLQALPSIFSPGHGAFSTDSTSLRWSPCNASAGLDARNEFYEQVYPLAEGYAKFEIIFKDKDPYEILGIPPYFYRPPNLTEEHVTSFAELLDVVYIKS